MAVKMLGPSFEKYKQTLTHSEPDHAQAFEDYLQAVLSARNLMTHGLLTAPGVSLQTEEGCRRAMRLLDEHLELAMPLFQMLTAHAAMVGSATGALNESELESIFSLLGGDLEMVEGEDPEVGV